MNLILSFIGLDWFSLTQEIGSDKFCEFRLGLGVLMFLFFRFGLDTSAFQTMIRFNNIKIDFLFPSALFFRLANRSCRFSGNLCR